MSSGTIISGGIFILFCITIYILASRSKKKKEKLFLQPLKRLAEMKNSKISDYDIWNNSIIGIDETSHFIFSVRKNNDSETSLCIDLSEIFRCRLNEVSRTTGPKEGNIKAFDKIELIFVNKDKNKADTILEIYNADTDRLNLSGELQIAEKWHKIINESIAKMTE